MVYLDTHLVVWLYAGDEKKLSRRCSALIEDNALFISPMVALELQYLYEVKKIKASSSKILATLNRDFNLQICNCSFENIITAATKEKWTRDPFDRIIVAHAKVKGSPLLTKDETIRENYKAAQW